MFSSAFLPPDRHNISIEGFDYAWFDFGGSKSGPSCLFVHGTGLHSMMWLTYAELLRDRFHILAFDHRGHGDSTKAREDYSWGAMAGDLAAFIRTIGLKKPICVGHSMGGATVALAEGKNPGLMSRAVLIDPIILPPQVYGIPMTYEQQPMAARTIHRRYEWDSRAQMVETYSKKLPFKTWRRDQLELYVNYGTEEMPGGRVRLKCPPQIEADCYLGGHQCNPWPYLPRIECPVLILRGSQSDTVAGVDVPKILAELPNARFEELPGTHFLPMEDPEAVTRSIAKFAGE
ncbi:alpha/beta hydrolase [Candidatus Sumerlaeota bacterium]|nr:alpha/beta hydrolase [Candidatus Sumerlaeota bacterium]